MLTLYVPPDDFSHAEAIGSYCSMWGELTNQLIVFAVLPQAADRVHSAVATPSTP